MIDSIYFESDKHRRYLIVERSEIEEGEKITLYVENGDIERGFTKYLPKDAHQTRIDVTPYCEALAYGKAEDVITSQHAMTDYMSMNRIAKIYVEYGEDGNTMEGYEPYGTWKNRVGFLTKLPYLQISKGVDSCDAITFSVFTWDDDTMRVHCADEVYTIGENVNNDSFLFQLLSEAKDVSLSSDVYGFEMERTRIPVRVVPRGMNTRRLIWRNEMGGYDAWAFEFLRESSFATTSEVFYSTTNGYTRTNHKSEALHTVETRELDDITAEVVSYVMASPEVYLWDYATSTAIPIDIVTEECRTYSDTELSGVQVSYRKRKRE